MCILTSLLLSSSLAGTKNLTVYRITPRNYTGITNLDTGDSAGDAFFGLYEKSAPVVCKTGGSMSNILCSNDPLLQIPGFNVYIQVEVEVDDRFGDYAECNPTKAAPHQFACGHFRHDRGCWNKDKTHPEWATQFADLCDPDVCVCDIIEKYAVGREYPKFGIEVPPETPKQCANNYYQLEHLTNGNKSTITKTKKNMTLADCCSFCSAQNSNNLTQCSSYTFAHSLLNKHTGTCILHGATDFTDLRPDLMATTGYFSGLGLAAFVQRATGELSNIMNGTWYSTQDVGECQPGQVLGKDCWWRSIRQTAQVNASCVNDAMIDKVVAQDKSACFASCQDPTDQSSDCFISCLFKTLVGNATASPAVPAVPRQVIVEAFESAFDVGGCPPVPDCPEPCLPPCWGVPKGDPCENDS